MARKRKGQRLVPPKKKRRRSVEEYYLVEKVLDYDGDQNKYLIKWLGFNEITWEPEANLNPALVDAYHKGAPGGQMESSSLQEEGQGDGGEDASVRTSPVGEDSPHSRQHPGEPAAPLLVVPQRGDPHRRRPAATGSAVVGALGPERRHGTQHRAQLMDHLQWATGAH